MNVSVAVTIIGCFVGPILLAVALTMIQEHSWALEQASQSAVVSRPRWEILADDPEVSMEDVIAARLVHEGLTPRDYVEIELDGKIYRHPKDKPASIYYGDPE